MSTDSPQTSTAGANTGSNGTRPDPAAVSQGQMDSYGTSLPLLGGVVAAVAAFLAVVVSVVSRRKQPTADERLAEATSALGSAAVNLGGRAAKRTAAIVEPVARDAAALTVVAASDAASLAAGGAKKVAAVAAEGAREVGESVESVQRAWSKLVTRLTIIVFGSAGYVLGARAGRERYDQIVGAARRAQGSISQMR